MLSFSESGVMNKLNVLNVFIKKIITKSKVINLLKII
jgi:hypothetical protein